MSSARALDESRRGVLRAFVNGAVAALGAGIAGVIGRFAVAPRAASAESWLRAAALGDLDPGTPYPAIVAVPRQDGWSRTRANETVFLVWDGMMEVRAMSATCTHLGCRVRWDDGAHRFRCPCHGGEYDAQGQVKAGPPPQPLRALRARISDAGDVEVLL
ncbi:MAG TPA: Rieske (2Fe-2S) protein [Vicinamibacterales bacterium]|nr:Rieske (2Fe-2S) protein [Vicinamibacterales bacterium]